MRPPDRPHPPPGLRSAAKRRFGRRPVLGMLPTGWLVGGGALAALAATALLAEPS